MRTLHLIASFLLCLTAIAFPAAARGSDADSAKIFVAGNPRFMSAHGFNGRFRPIHTKLRSRLEAIPNKAVCRDLAERLEDERAGFKILESITHDFSAIPANDMQSLNNCYIALTYTHEESNKKGDKKHTPYYALFHVEVSPEMARNLSEAIANGRIPTDLNLRITPINHGKADVGRTLTSISRSIPQLTANGQLTNVNPPTINFGSNSGLKKGDLVSIYDNDNLSGNNKPVSRIRVTQIWDVGASGYCEDRKLNEKNIGDKAVRTPANPVRLGLMASYAKNNWGANLIVDARLVNSPCGLGHHLLANAGFIMPTHRTGTFAYPGTYVLVGFKSFYYYNIGVAYGLSIPIAGRMQAMPFAGVQYDGSHLKLVPHGIPMHVPDNIKNGSNLRFPIGLRYSFNIKYPIKFFVEAGYAFTADIGNAISYINQARKNVNVDRSGVFVNAGFTF